MHALLHYIYHIFRLKKLFRKNFIPSRPTPLFHTKKAAYQPEADSRLAQAYSPKRANSRAPEKRRVLMRNSSADV